MSASRWGIRALVVVVGALVAGSAVASPALADAPKIPEPVAEYFASGLVPRLMDLYGAAKVAPHSEIGPITRVSVFTDDFLSGGGSDAPVRLTNQWVAAVSPQKGSAHEQPIGLATVWINPATDVPELADFALDPDLVVALAAAPKDSVLVSDKAHSAWFALTEKVLTPLVPGTSGIVAATTPDEAQDALTAGSPSAPKPDAANQGLLIAGITLGAVVLVLGVFVLMPARRKNGPEGADPTPESDSSVAEPSESA